MASSSKAITSGLLTAIGDLKNGRRLRHEKVSTIVEVDGSSFSNFAGDYFISSDRGIYLLRDGKLSQLLADHTYGIAFHDGALFTATDDGANSQVLRCHLPDDLRPGQQLLFQPIYQTRISEKGSRIHQLARFKNSIVVCQTSTNSFVLLSPESGEVEREIRPFSDENGVPREGDYNHINSASACGEVLLIGAYSANYRADGHTAMLGVVDENRVKGYVVEHRGAHDVYISGREVYFCDSLGSKDGSPLDDCGFLKINNCPFAAEYFGRPPGYFVRGLCKSGDEFVIGHSHKGERKKRFEGTGALLRCDAARVLEEVSTPFAQLYDILDLRGETFPTPPAVTTWGEVNALMELVFGPPTYEAVLPE